MQRPRLSQDKGLAEQKPAESNVSKITALSLEVISKQATINIGTIGHVAHGKTTVVKSISGVQTTRFKQELGTNKTIKLGYANAKLYKCPLCPRPACYKAYGSSKEDSPPCDQPTCSGRLELLRHVSFVDCPGHDVLMATMLNGVSVMDAALLIVAGNESCPQPQTSEHLAAVEMMRLENIIILQNKFDLVNQATASAHYAEIQAFIRGTVAEDAPVIPISAQMRFNVDVLVEYLIKKIPVPNRGLDCPAQMMVVRSFDVNKPGEEVDGLKGGVVGGSLVRGMLKVGDEIEIRPGFSSKNAKGDVLCTPIKSVVCSMNAEKNDLQYAIPGGLIGVGSRMDPALTRRDGLVGSILGAVGHLPDVFMAVEVSFYLLRRLLGVNSAGGRTDTAVRRLAKGEMLMVNVGPLSVGGRVVRVKKDAAKLSLTRPVCTQEGAKVALSRRIDQLWRLVGWGQITKGIRVELNDQL